MAIYDPVNHHPLMICNQIRASEDILTLTRQMKEMWLFGQLNTLSESHAEEKTEEDARAVAALLQKLVDGQGQGVKPRA